jgi:hypothetical protein
MTAERNPGTLTDDDIRTTWTRQPAGDFRYRPHADRGDVSIKDIVDGTDHMDHNVGDGRDFNILYPLKVKAP